MALTDTFLTRIAEIIAGQSSDRDRIVPTSFDIEFDQAETERINVDFSSDGTKLVLSEPATFEVEENDEAKKIVLITDDETVVEEFETSISPEDPDVVKIIVTIETWQYELMASDL